MDSLKKELFFKYTNKNWLRLHYSNEKFDLFFITNNNKVNFQLSDKNEQSTYLSGLVFFTNEHIEFEYNEQESAWFKNTSQLQKIKKENINDLLENLFCSMLIQGDSI